MRAKDRWPEGCELSGGQLQLGPQEGLSGFREGLSATDDRRDGVEVQLGRIDGTFVPSFRGRRAASGLSFRYRCAARAFAVESGVGKPPPGPTDCLPGWLRAAPGAERDWVVLWCA